MNTNDAPLVGMNRLTIANGKLPDGVVIPPGYQVTVNLKHIHRDPQIYSNPHVFDPFRFSKLREAEGKRGARLSLLPRPAN